MRQIKVLGTGCLKCQQVAENARAAADELGIDYEIEKVVEISKIMQYGVMMTPGLVIDGQVKAAGKVPGVEEIKSMLEAQ